MDNEMTSKLNNIERFLKDIQTDIGTQKVDTQENFEKIREDIKDIKTDLGIHKTDTQENFREIKTELSEMKSKISDTYNAVDGFVKIVDKLENEFIIIKEDLKRVKEVIKEKLGVDLT